MTTRVLVTDSNSPKALAIVRALGRSYTVYTADKDPISLAGFSRYNKKYIRYCYDHLNQFAEIIFDICRQYKINIVVTPEEQTSYLISRSKELFEKNEIRTAVPNFESLKIGMSKMLTIQHALQIGVPVPRSIILEDVAQASKVARQIGYPVVVRPVTSHYWTGDRFISSSAVGYAANEEELKHCISRLNPLLPPPILQEYVAGHGMGVLLILNKDGLVYAECAQEGLRDYRPTGSGFVLRRSASVHPQLREYSLRLLKQIGWDAGVVEVEFRVSEDLRDIYLMEINPRFWSSIQLSIDAGVNFPQYLVDLVLEKQPEKPNFREDMVLRWWLGDLIRFLRVLKGRPVGYKGVFPGRWQGFVDFFGKQPSGTLNEIFRRNDPLPAVMEIACMAIKQARRLKKH